MMLIGGTSGGAPSPSDLKKLKLPPGLSISVWAEVPGARSLALGPDGVIFVGAGGLGGVHRKVYAVKYNTKTMASEKTLVVRDQLNSPNGVAYREGSLYVAEISRLIAFRNIQKNLNSAFEKSSDFKNLNLEFDVLPFAFPSDTHHGWKFIRFDGAGKLYVPVGAPCNVCDPGTEYARIYQLDLKEKTKTVYAQGVRNTVGFDWDPVTGQMWFTDNGRDWLGDDRPPCEINKVSQVGEHFGFPFCHGKDRNGKYILDPQFKTDKSCDAFTAPQINLPAHVAPLGMRFYTGESLGADLKNQILFAEHGSWNRSVPQGYRVSLAEVQNVHPPKYKPFIEGWLQDGKSWGRPVDVEILPDG